ncbi:hypothetical protein quinque_006911 [Culex quinquefasciatus]|nr:zinc finger protein 709 isoform X2 [Culex quinquefasciatus]XP_038110453.1 zinc finger protein 709 isoform X2 [Culex quinquefasciatus]
MASEQSTDSNVVLQYPVTVKEEPQSLPEVDDRIPAIYSGTVVTKEELILEDDYLDNEEDEDMEVDSQTESFGEGFRCNICQETFLDQEMLSQHLLILCDKQYERFIDIELLNKDGVIKCTKCKKPFKVFTAARFHFENHMTLEKFRYECDVCYLGFGTKAIYLKHMMTHKKNVELSLLKYQCHHCDEVYTDRATFREHLERHESLNAGKYKCETCSSFYTTKSDLKRHELSFHKKLSAICRDACEESPDVPLYCKRCDIQFDSKKAFNAHIRWLQTNDERLQKTAKDSASAGPMAVEDSSLNFQCTKCDKRFETAEALKKHAKTHSIYINKSGMLVMVSEREYKCTQCDKIFSNKVSASEHVRNHLVRLKGTYQCKTCKLRCISERRLRIHMKMHEKAQSLSKKRDEMTSKQPVDKVQASVKVKQEPQTTVEVSVKREADAVVVKAEPLEPEASSIKEEFIIEEVPEEEEAPVQPSTDGHLECPQCGRKFLKQHLLQNHIRDHRNLETERYKCDVCGKCFPKKGNLDIHKKIHKRGTRYECQTCHEKFTNHMGLMKHERVHEMDPKYVEILDNIPQDETRNWRCVMCEAKFPLRTAAYGHLRRHISRLEDTFLCKICGLRCTKKSTFRAHMQMHDSWNELAQQPSDNAGESEEELPNPDVVCEKGEVPLHCKTCDKFFLTKRDLHVHVQKSEIRFLKLKLAAEKGIKVDDKESKSNKISDLI